jgi:hypothetical protein
MNDKPDSNETSFDADARLAESNIRCDLFVLVLSLATVVIGFGWIWIRLPR